jgi:hypothetical protein
VPFVGAFDLDNQRSCENEWDRSRHLASGCSDVDSDGGGLYTIIGYEPKCGTLLIARDGDGQLIWTRDELFTLNLPNHVSR